MNHENIISPETAELVASIEAVQGNDHESSEERVADLIGYLAHRCSQPEVRAKYDAYPIQMEDIASYPVDADGYATAFDPLEQESELYDVWRRYGVAVARSVAPDALCAAAVGTVRDTLAGLGGSDAADDRGVPILSRGFFEVYHDDALAQLRQSLRLYLHHVIVWGRADLWTTYDRFGVKLPGHDDSKALPLHVDQNPNVHPGFQTTQGVLALEDCPTERGTLVVVPGSKSRFPVYGRMALNAGEYVELDTANEAADVLAANAQPLPLRKGSVATWDSRTTHANSANVSEMARFVALVSAGPARPDDMLATAARADAFASGRGSNVRNALMHASKRPRYDDPDALQALRVPERLSLLGKLMYGQVRYDEV